jgi:hypothetical protein
MVRRAPIGSTEHSKGTKTWKQPLLYSYHQRKEIKRKEYEQRPKWIPKVTKNVALISIRYHLDLQTTYEFDSVIAGSTFARSLLYLAMEPTSESKYAVHEAARQGNSKPISPPSNARIQTPSKTCK